MKKLATVLFGLSSTACALAQEARSPDELAKFVRVAIEAKDMRALARLVHPGASPTSVDRFKGALEACYGADNLAVFPVPKDDAQAVHKFASMSALPNFKPLASPLRCTAATTSGTSSFSQMQNSWLNKTNPGSGLTFIHDLGRRMPSAAASAVPVPAKPLVSRRDCSARVRLLDLTPGLDLLIYTVTSLRFAAPGNMRSVLPTAAV